MPTDAQEPNNKQSKDTAVDRQTLDILDSLRKQMVPIASDMLENMNRLEKEMTGINSKISAAYNILPTMPAIPSVIQETAKALAQIATFYQPQMSNMARWLQEHRKREHIADCFGKCGLWIAPSMTSKLVLDVVERYEQGKKITIPSLVDGFYRRDNWNILKDAIARWTSYDFFAPRMDIFEDALEAHIDRKWNLSIPALLPHIEGIAREIALQNKLILPPDTLIISGGAKTYQGALFAKLDASQVTATMDVTISSLLYYLETTLYAFMDFRRNYPRIRRSKILNRHAILHGFQLNYGTRLNSLRCFLALDSLSMLEGNTPELVS